MRSILVPAAFVAALCGAVPAVAPAADVPEAGSGALPAAMRPGEAGGGSSVGDLEGPRRELGW
jgi:hypothetical protein